MCVWGGMVFANLSISAEQVSRSGMLNQSLLFSRNVVLMSTFPKLASALFQSEVPG